jgi:hypothetical protein
MEKDLKLPAHPARAGLAGHVPVKVAGRKSVWNHPNITEGSPLFSHEKIEIIEIYDASES